MRLHCEEKDGVPDVPLHILLSYPFFWKPSKICLFFLEIHKLLRDAEHGSSATQLEIVAFKQLLSDEAKQKCILNPINNNWRQSVGDKHFEILTTRYFMRSGVCESARSVVNETCICDLVEVIRHKYVHSSDFPSDKKAELGWFNANGVLDEFMFVKYWNNRVPKLLLFLWHKFRYKAASLHEYYAEIITEFNMIESPERIAMAIEKSLEEIIGNGLLETRFSAKNGKAHIDLEFFSLNPGTRFQDGSTLSVIMLAQKYIKFVWDAVGNTESKSLVYFPENTSTSGVKTTIGMVFVNPSNLNRLHTILTNCGTIQRFVILTKNVDASLVQAVVQRLGRLCQDTFTENPLKWDELAPTFRERLLEFAEVKFQNRICKLVNVLPEGRCEQDEIMFNIYGQSLNTLLRNSQIEIFSKLENLSPTSNYIERIIVNRSLIDISIFSEELSYEDILVVQNITAQAFNEVTDVNSESVYVINCETTNIDFWEEFLLKKFRFITLEKAEQNCFSIVQKLKEKLILHNFHILHHVNDSMGSKFLWVNTLGNPSSFGNLLEKANQGMETFHETEFLDSADESGQRILIILDKPGMGKSQILASLAQKITLKHNNRCVALISISDFIERLEEYASENSEENNESQIYVVLANFLCKNEFEHALLKHFVYSKSSVLNTDILLDGLDELSVDNRKLAINSINNILKTLSGVRVWFASRDYMLKEIMENFNSVRFGLQPFSKEDKILFLTRHWLATCKKSKKCSELPDAIDLKNFATKCSEIKICGNNTAILDSDRIEKLVKDTEMFNKNEWERFAKNHNRTNVLINDTEIAGIPLQCRMIAEINEEKVLSGEYKNDKIEQSYSITELFDKLIEKKIEIFLKEKSNFTKNMKHPIAKRELEYSERCHTYFALKLIMSEEVATEFRNALLLAETSDSELGELALSQGIIQKVKPLAFVHRTFAEYFLIKFACKVLKGHSLSIKSSDKIFKQLLWNNIFSIELSNPDKCCFRQDVTIKHPTVLLFFNAMWEKSDKQLNKFIMLAAKAYSSVKHAFLKVYCPLLFALQTTKFDSLAGFVAIHSGEIFPLFYLLLRYPLPMLYMGPGCCTIVKCVPDFLSGYYKYLDSFTHFGKNRNGIFHYVVRFLHNIPLYQVFEIMSSRKIFDEYLTKDLLEFHTQSFATIYKNVTEFVKCIASLDASLLTELNHKGYTPSQLLRRLYEKPQLIDRVSMFTLGFLNVMSSKLDLENCKICALQNNSNEAPF